MSKYFVDYLPAVAGEPFDVYFDSEAYCLALSTALSQAKKSIYLSGRHFLAGFKLSGRSLIDILIERANNGVDIRLLVNQTSKPNKVPDDESVYWAETDLILNELSGNQRIQCSVDYHPGQKYGSVHNQKCIIIDESIAFWGSMDLSYFDSDTKKRSQSNNVECVQASVKRRSGKNNSLSIILDDFAIRWNTKKANDPVVRKKKKTPVTSEIVLSKSMFEASNYAVDPGQKPWLQMVRSRPANQGWVKSIKPDWNKSYVDDESSCKEAYLKGIGFAKHYIYLESHYITDEEIWRALRDAAWRNRKNPNFVIFLVVPEVTQLSSEQERVVKSGLERICLEFQNAKSPLIVCARQLSVENHPFISNVLLVDDKWGLIGSASAGGASLQTVCSKNETPNTELSSIIYDIKRVKEYRHTIMKLRFGIEKFVALKAFGAHKKALNPLIEAGKIPGIRMFRLYSEVLSTINKSAEKGGNPPSRWGNKKQDNSCRYLHVDKLIFEEKVEGERRVPLQYRQYRESVYLNTLDNYKRINQFHKVYPALNKDIKTYRRHINRAIVLHNYDEDVSSMPFPLLHFEGYGPGFLKVTEAWDNSDYDGVLRDISGSQIHYQLDYVRDLTKDVCWIAPQLSLGVNANKHKKKTVDHNQKESFFDSWGLVEEVYEQLNYQKPNKKMGLVVSGHSAGGRAAVQHTLQLMKNGVHVQALLLFDPHLSERQPYTNPEHNALKDIVKDEFERLNKKIELKDGNEISHIKSSLKLFFSVGAGLDNVYQHIAKKVLPAIFSHMNTLAKDAGWTEDQTMLWQRNFSFAAAPNILPKKDKTHMIDETIISKKTHNAMLIDGKSLYTKRLLEFDEASDPNFQGIKSVVGDNSYYVQGIKFWKS